jgi:signal transduction histidine kinase
VIRSLYSKLALALLGLFCLIGTAFVAISIYSTDRYQQEVNQKLNRDLAALIAAEKIILKDNVIDTAALEEIFHMLMVINPSIEVYLLDREGKILAFSAEPGKVKRDTIDLGPVRQWIGGDAALPILGDDPRDRKGRKIFTAAPIQPKGTLEGYLYVILGGETYDSIIEKIQGSYILRLSIRVVLISLVLSLAAGLIIFAYLTRRLKRFAAAIDNYESGIAPEMLDLPEVKSAGQTDEIDRLTAAFHRMTERINQQMHRLEKSDSMRRELVASVSHDLRTPLATLRGYIETLHMKEDSLTEEERKDYLRIALHHCERLEKLIAGLFELAKLEAQDRLLHQESFTLGELVQDVVQKFSLTARQRNVDIITSGGSELPFAFADIALIERVLENLLDNALRYTPEQGSITIALSAGEDRNITVQVRDTGCGISEEDLPRIFDRFYQADRTGKDRTSHSGLGLAVTKRILELHGTAIHVYSDVDAGTTFSFTLPASSDR